ncbi:MAG TPA: DUF202 domain-containing protein [Candidatus Limnocylindrales bacterium]|nr:DUF202 domain-containing protein [Candidatus Limnocylindrales bacterium]
MTSYDPDDPRQYMAAERTFLSWMRTGISLMGFGFVVARFGLFLREIAATTQAPLPPRHAFSLEVGVSLIVMGVLLIAASALRLRRYVSSLRSGTFTDTFDIRLPVVAAVLLSLLGAATVVYLWRI